MGQTDRGRANGSRTQKRVMKVHNPPKYESYWVEMLNSSKALEDLYRIDLAEVIDTSSRSSLQI